MKELLAKQRAFFLSHTTKDVDFRIQQLKKLRQLLLSNEVKLHEAIYQDFKKSSFDNYTAEVGLVLHDIDHAIKMVRKWARVRRVRTNLINFPARSYSIPEPLGVVLVIGAWNYPYQLSLAPVVAAMAAGNTVVLKPSELPAHTSKVMADIVNMNFDPDYFKVVEGGIPETTELLQQKWDKIFFTGSVPVGKIVYQAAAKNLVPVTLELGGKSPAIVTPGCDLKMAVRRLIWAKFLNSGQTCIAPDYILVHQSIAKEFLALAKSEIEQGHYAVENGNYVQIINDKAVERLAGLIDPQKVVEGGKVDRGQRYIAPTLLYPVDFDHVSMADEIFGPILPIIEYTELDKAIQQINARPKPLACYVFTKDSSIRKKVLREVSFGGGGVNEAVMHVSNPHLPFGGVGDSGIGSYHGETGFRTFSHFKSILDKPTWLEFNLKYYPQSEGKLKLIRWLMG